MRKTLILMFIFFLVGDYIFSQTWTEKEDSGYLREITIISGDDFIRLLKQYEETSDNPLGDDYFGNPRGSINLYYKDALVLGSGLPVVKGTRPKLNGYYYLLIKRITIVGTFNMLVYGNSNTGRMEIEFNTYGDFVPRTNKYLNQRNKFWGWVNGE